MVNIREVPKTFPPLNAPIFISLILRITAIATDAANTPVNISSHPVFDFTFFEIFLTMTPFFRLT